MKNYKNSSFFIIAIGIFGLAIIGGMFYGRQTQPAVTSCSNEDTKIYISQQFHFSLEYPAILSLIQEDGDSVSFSTPEGPWDFFVSTKETTFTSAKEWLVFQPKGNASNSGIEAILWFSYDAMYPTVFVAEYEIVDYNGNVPIYGKILSAVHVQNGKIYKITFNTQIPTNEVPHVSPTMMDVISSFNIINE